MVKVIITPEIKSKEIKNKTIELAEASEKHFLKPKILFCASEDSYRTAVALKRELKKSNENPIEVKLEEILLRPNSTIATYLLQQADDELTGYMGRIPSRSNLILVVNQKIADSFPSYFAIKTLGLKAGVTPLAEGKAVLFEFQKAPSPREYYTSCNCAILP